jgi:DNA polymerase/3'-5' exonuclease PolX
VPYLAFPFAELHYTGSAGFMRHVREQAARIGYRLSLDSLKKDDKIAMEVFGVDGLRFLEQDGKDTRVPGDTVELDSEEDLFRFLKMRYVPPQERNWY